MSNYRPVLNNNMIPLFLLIPRYENKLGVEKKTFPSKDEGILFFGSYKTYGGTERDVNGVYSIEDTAVIETWFNPEITSECRIAREDGAVFEILGEPENIDMRNQFLKFKIKRIKGRA